MDDDDRWTAEELNDYLARMDRELEEARRRPNNRQVQFEANGTVEIFAEMKFPTGLGNEIDKLLIKPLAAAKILKRDIDRAQAKVYDNGDEIAAVSRSIEILRKALLPLSEHLVGLHQDRDF